MVANDKKNPGKADQSATSSHLWFPLAQLDYHQAVSKNAVMGPFFGNLYANHPFKLTESGS